MLVQHVLSARQFNPEELHELFLRTDYMWERQAVETRSELIGHYAGRLLAPLFYEPSTRTRLSFESAGLRLGMGILGTENAREFSSAIKGETIEDTIRVVDGYADMIILRHHETGSADRAAAVSRVPIINAGDGKGEHPTQALLDLYTIQKEKGRLDDLVVVIGGDLKHGRTARSLAQMLSLYPSNQIRFVSTPDLQIGQDIKESLKNNGVIFEETEDMYAALDGADVIYWTRLQKERIEGNTLQAGFTLGEAALSAIKEDAVIMHPLPRVDEIAPEVDADPRAAYFRQAENGLYVRMALIDSLLGRTDT